MDIAGGTPIPQAMPCRILKATMEEYPEDMVMKRLSRLLPR
jgi:hypothetical protein